MSQNNNHDSVADTELQVDLLVVGAGIAGLTAAAYSAQHGLKVLVIEKAADIGGSSALSAGGLAKPASYDIFRQVNPSGDRELARLLLDSYDDLIAWILSLDTKVTDPADVESVLGFPATIRGIDIIGYLNRCRAHIEGSEDCFVVTHTQVEKLLLDSGRVTGAIVVSEDGATTVKAALTLLATGGFQNDAELRARFISSEAKNMLVRSNPVSAGDGLRLGLSVGGTLTEHMNRFYGHTVPAPLNHDYLPRDYVRLAQFYLNTRCVILDRTGGRFTDESDGYYENTRQVSLQPGSRALLIGDQQIRDEDAAGGVISSTLGYERLDRIIEAEKSGANVAVAETLVELEKLVAPWGYKNIASAIENYNKAIAHNLDMQPGRIRNRRTLSTPPYFAMEIQPAITFTFGGLKINGNTEVVDDSGVPIPGLLGAGSDIGGAYHERYSGGLVMAGVQGLQAGKTAVGNIKK